MREEWGSVTEIDKGKRYRLRYWADTPEGYRRVSETVRGTRRDAYNVLAQRRLEHSSDAPCPTAGQAYEQWWLADFETGIEGGDRSASTLSSYQSNWRRWCEPRWGGVPLDQIRPLDVQQWLSTMPRTVAERAKIIMIGICDYAVRYEVVESNVFRARYVMPARSTSCSHDKGIWTADEVEGIWRAVLGTWLEGAFLVQAYGGARVGEALAASPGSVERDELGGVPVAVVSILRQVDSSGRVKDKLKTEQSRRYVPIPGPAGERLCELAESCAEPFLTGNGIGGHTTQQTYRDAMREAIEGAGIPYHPINSLRNSWQTRMRWEWEMPPYLIEPIMGHVARGTTGKYYDRPTRDMLVKAVVDAYKAHPYSFDWDNLGPE